jgi:hypothetical protein
MVDIKLTAEKSQRGLGTSGQSTVEYVLVTAVVVSGILMAFRALSELKITEKITAKFQTDFAMTYKYGHPKARGFDEGTPEYHPRINAGGTNFRIFLNPR